MIIYHKGWCAVLWRATSAGFWRISIVEDTGTGGVNIRRTFSGHLGE